MRMVGFGSKAIGNTVLAIGKVQSSIPMATSCLQGLSKMIKGTAWGFSTTKIQSSTIANSTKVFLPRVA